MNRALLIAGGLMALTNCAAPGAPTPIAEGNWPVTGNDAGNSRYSRLTQITNENVRGLEVAWVYHAGGGVANGTQIQATPIVMEGVLFSTNNMGAAFAVRADNGIEVWKFDPYAGRRNEGGTNRGVVFWSDGRDKRIFFVAGSRLYALNATTGAVIPGFGTGGWIDLSKGIGRDSLAQSVVATSPGVMYKDVLIQGSRVGEGDGAAPGHVRAFDVRTGAVRWMFHTIPQPGEVGYETWPPDAWKTVGGANSWGGMAVDVPRGIVYVPTGSATPDFYGGERLGANLFSNSLLALDASTGKRLWHYQTVHHDLFDRDLPVAPNLLTVVREGRRVDAVAQITKSGFVFLFDRVTGAPLFPVEERAVAASDIPGEQAWPTQPFPVKPAPFGRQRVLESDITDLTSEAHAAMLARFRTLRNEGPYTPGSLAGTIVLPGFDGGGEWGGAAVDGESSVLYVNGSDVPWINALVPVAQSGNMPASGASVYTASCASCHGADRRGDGDRSPSLLTIRGRLSTTQVREIVDKGKGFMPGFPNLSVADRDAVTAYVMGQVNSATEPPRSPAASASSGRAPYRLRGYERWRDAEGYPAIKPPWGTLNAIDLNSGDFLWKIPLGEYPALKARGLGITGTEQYGGPIVTAGGVLFIAATLDEKFRAFDKRTGALLWEATLPAAGYATPSTYMMGGRQYVVIAAGGGKLGTKSGDSYVAFALPR